MNSESSQPDWRAGQEKSDRQYSWRKPQAYEQKSKPFWRRFLRYVASGIGLVVTLYLIWWLINFFNQEQIVVVSIGVPFQGEMTKNPFVERDTLSLEALEDLSNRLLMQNVLFQNENLDDEIESFAEHRHASSLIVYVNCWSGLLTGTDQSATECYLLEQGTQPDTLSPIPLARLWDQLKSMPAEQHKLVLLDISRVRPDWRLGTLPAVIDEPVYHQLEALQIPNLVVMLSDGISTGSQGSPVLGGGHSAFAHFALKGMGRDADVNADRRIDVIELYDYVKANVQNWSTDCRNAERPQSPILFPSRLQLTSDLADLNFTILRHSNTSTVSSDLPVLKRPDMGPLREAMRLRDEKREILTRRSPLLLTRLNYWLARAETDYLNWDQEGLSNSLEMIATLQSDIERLTPSPSDLLATHNIDPFVKTVLLDKLDTEEEMEQENSRAIPISPQTLVSPSEIAEAHLMGQCLPNIADDNPGLADSAVSIRRKADKLFGYPLGVFDLIESEFRQFDQNLREAENLVLADAPSNKIADQIDVAENQRIDLDHRMDELSRSRAIVNRAALILPQLARWVAFREMNGESQKLLSGIAKSAKRKQTDSVLGAEIDVDTTLEFEILKAFATFRDVKKEVLRGNDVLPKANKLEDDLKVIESEIVGDADFVLSLSTEFQHSHHRQAMEFLHLDIFDAGLRTKLLERIVEYEQALNTDTKVQTSKQSAAVSAPSSRNPEADSDVVATDCAWRTYWMLQNASLSISNEGTLETWCDQWIDVIRTRQPDGKRKDNLKAIELAHDLSAKIASKWSELKSNILQEVTAEAKTFKTHAERLRRAEIQARLLPAYEARDLESPTRQEESLHLLKRLSYLASRCTEDFWANCDSQSTTEMWYAQSAKIFKETATEFSRDVSTARWILPELEATQKRLNELEQASISPVIGSGNEDQRVSLQFARQQSVQVATKADPELPQGTAVVWLPGHEKVDVSPSTKPVPANESQPNLKFEVKHPLVGDAFTDLKIVPEARFRGHRWPANQNFLVDAAEKTGRQWTFLPESGTGSIQVNGSQQRKILFVLDCSLSMLDDFKPGSKKFREATRTLKEIWGKLFGEHVGLMAFGNRVPNAKPVGWETDYELLSDLELNNQQYTDRLVSIMDKLAPKGSTPAVGAMVEGLRILQRKSSEPGMLIVVTDGAAQDGGAAPGLPNMWDEFEKRYNNESVFIVAYNVVSQDEKEKLKIFRKTAESNKIKFKEAPTTAELKTNIEDALKPREYYVLQNGKEVAVERLGSVVEALKPGNYTVEFAGSELPVPLMGGQNVVLNLTWDGARATFDRIPETRNETRIERATGGPAKDSDPVYAIVKNPKRNASSGEMEFSIILENGRKDIVELPEEVYFSVLENDKLTFSNITVESSSGYAAPAYKVKLDFWPAEEPAVVHAAWKMQRTRPDKLMRLSKLTEANKPVEMEIGESRWELTASFRDELEIDARRISKGPSMVSNFPVSLDMLRVEIGTADNQGYFTPRTDLKRDVEVFEEEQRVLTKYSDEDLGNRDLLTIAITLPESLLRDAFTTKDGIKILELILKDEKE